MAPAQAAHHLPALDEGAQRRPACAADSCCAMPRQSPAPTLQWLGSYSTPGSATCPSLLPPFVQTILYNLLPESCPNQGLTTWYSNISECPAQPFLRLSQHGAQGMRAPAFCPALFVAQTTEQGRGSFWHDCAAPASQLSNPRHSPGATARCRPATLPSQPASLAPQEPAPAPLQPSPAPRQSPTPHLSTTDVSPAPFTT